MELIVRHAIVSAALGCALGAAPASSAAAGAFCDRGLLGRLDTATAYRLREGNRCEGTYAKEVSSGLLEVRSFVAAEIEYAFERPADLEVRWPTPPWAGGAVHLRGTSLSRGVYYRMDTAAATSFTWPLDLLYELKVTARDLGVAAWFDPESEPRVYLPLTVGQGRAPSAEDTLRLWVACNYEISTLFVKVVRDSWPGAAATSSEVVAEHPPDDFGFPAQQPFPIEIQRPREPGVYAVEIGFEYDDNAVAGNRTGFDTVFFFSAGGRGPTMSPEAEP